MDYCVYCEKPLQNNVCSSCSIIYEYEFHYGIICKNCGHKTVTKRSLTDKHLWTCTYCQFHYFFTKDYKKPPNPVEFYKSIEKTCTDCHGRVIYDETFQEFVCLDCGLLHPIVL